MANYVNISKY